MRIIRVDCCCECPYNNEINGLRVCIENNKVIKEQEKAYFDTEFFPKFCKLVKL